MHSTPTPKAIEAHDALIARADEHLARLTGQHAKIERDSARPPWAGPGLRSPLKRPGLGAVVGLPLAACIVVAASYAGEATRPQATPLAQAATQQAAPTATEAVPDQTQLLQTIARGLAKVERDIEELKASQEEMKRELARVSEQNLPKTSSPPTQPPPTLRKPERTLPHARARPHIPREEWYYSDWW
jgi:hypothetical protein